MIHHQEKAAEEYPLALLYQKYAKVVLSYLDHRISIKEDAEDLLLEVFLAALENQVWTTLTAKGLQPAASPAVSTHGMRCVWL
jgi:hypothetical protein